MIQEEKTQVRCYGKAELAHLYFPELSHKMAIKKLRRWIKKCNALYDAMNERSHDVNARMFSAGEVRLIFYYLGEP